MRIALSGTHGFIGSAVEKRLLLEGHEVIPIVRFHQPGVAPVIEWRPDQNYVGPIPKLDAVVHLAGENVLGRWSPAKKRRIRESRVLGTRLLCEAVTKAADPATVFLCASAVGFYGDRRGPEELTEESAAGRGFLAEVCQEWERAARCNPAAPMRVVNFRLGVVLDPSGGALKKMLPAFRWGLAGPLGSGRQFFSWISLADTVSAIVHLLNSPHLSGPVNLVAPNPVTNEVFTKTLAQAVHRPAFWRVPQSLLRLVLDGVADEMLLASQKTLPAKLQQDCFRFRHPSLPAAFSELLAK